VLGGDHLLLLVTRSILTPAFVVYAAIDDEGVGLYASALMNLLVISVGSYLLFLSLTGNRLAALFGAVVFSYCGFNLSWFLWQHVNTSIWIPWMLFFAIRITQSGDVRHVPWLALASTLMILGGFPTVAVYGYIALFLMFVCWSLFSRNPLRLMMFRSALGVVGVLLSFMLAYLFLYCLEESLGRLDLSYRRGGSAFRSVKDLLLFILPFSRGPLTLGKTGYVGLLPMMLFIPALWLTWRSRFDWRYAWGLSLVIVISPMAFAWIPMEYIRQVPLIGTSMISRLTLIIALGFSLLAALVLAAAYKRVNRTTPVWANLVMVILLIVQVADQRQVFQTLVGKVKAETIYPITKTIDHARNDIKPLQNVLSDRGFIFGGVLSAYGLSEWFAHGFHTVEEKHLLKEIVDSPFLTPTAAGYSCDQIQFNDAQGLAYLAVRYALCSTRSKHENGVQRKAVFDTVAGSRDSAGLDLMQHKVVQRAEVGGKVNFDLIEIPLLMGDATNFPVVSLKLRNETVVVAETSPCILEDNSTGIYLSCRFPKQVGLDVGRYELEVAVKQKQDAILVVRRYDNDSTLLQLLTDGVASEGVLGLRGYTLIPPSSYHTLLSDGNESYDVHEPEPGMILVENRLVNGSAYFVSSLNGNPSTQYDLLRLNSYHESSMQFEYMGNKPGWVVIPVRNYPGWTFKVNTDEVEHSLFKGVLPAVQVNGGERIDFSYRPVHYKMPALISMLGLMLCLMLFFRAQNINQWFSDRIR
jgi:hypothetical protein